MKREEDIVKALDELVAFLRRFRLNGHADDIENLRNQLVQQGLEAVATELTGIDLWGGAGSYFDLSICRESFPFLPADLDLERANKEYGRLLLRLAEAIKQAGLSSYWFDSSHKILKKWREEGII